MLVFAKQIGDFINRYPSMKILALSFLLLIGVLLTAEGLGQHINKGYIYFAMAFALMVELLNIRFRAKQTASRRVGFFAAAALAACATIRRNAVGASHRTRPPGRDRGWPSGRSVQAVSEIHPEDIAELLEDLSAKEAVLLVRALPTEMAADVVERLTPHRQVLGVQRRSTGRRAAELLAEMDPDDRVDLLQGLEEDDATALLSALERRGA